MVTLGNCQLPCDKYQAASSVALCGNLHETQIVPGVQIAGTPASIKAW
jgi:hypothetical protein